MLERDEMLVGRHRRTRTGGSKESRAISRMGRWWHTEAQVEKAH